MKIKIAVAIVAILAAFGLTGCKPKTTMLAGQVFIVTQSGDNVKLGDVEIFLIEKSQVVTFLANKEPGIDAEIASRRQEYEVAKQDYTNAYTAYAPYNEFESEEVRNHAVKGLDQSVIVNLQNVAWAAEDRKKAQLEKLINSEQAENYFAGFSPVAAQKTLSDADGKFSFVYPQDKPLTIYATAQRTTSNGTENYYWLIDAPTNAETIPVLLSNNNLISVDPDNFFKLKPR